VIIDLNYLKTDFHSYFECFSGWFEYVHKQGSSSSMTVDYDERFQFILLGLGEAYEEIALEKKDWLTGDYVRSSAEITNGLFRNFYTLFIGEYAKCRCSETGQHRFKVTTSTNVSDIHDFGTLRLKGELS
jgi:hypothetical protein